jgi:hypothetical protein
MQIIPILYNIAEAIQLHVTSPEGKGLYLTPFVYIKRTVYFVGSLPRSKLKFMNRLLNKSQNFQYQVSGDLQSQFRVMGSVFDIINTSNNRLSSCLHVSKLRMDLGLDKYSSGDPS